MYSDIYFGGEHPHIPTFLQGCKKEDLSFFQRQTQYPSRLCEEELKESLAVVFWDEQLDGESCQWQESEEKNWANRYNIPIFCMIFTPISQEDQKVDIHDGMYIVEKKEEVYYFSYQNNQSLHNAVGKMAEILRELSLEKYRNCQRVTPMEHFLTCVQPQDESKGTLLQSAIYTGGLFCEKSPMGRGVFSLVWENNEGLLCCGIWHLCENGDFFALHGKIFKHHLEWDSLVYQGDFFVTQEGTLLFMDGNASCYREGELLYRGGIYGDSMEDYCLFGETFLSEETFSGYYSSKGQPIYGTLKQYDQPVYEGSFQNKGYKSYGEERLGKGKRYTGQFSDNNFCGQGSMEYSTLQGDLTMFGILSKEKESFLELSHILSSQGQKWLSTANPLSFPLVGEVKIEYPSGITYVGEIDICKKTEGVFRKGNHQWQVTKATDYSQFDSGFLHQLLEQLDQEEQWWTLAFSDSATENIIAYHLAMCDYLQELHHAFSTKTIDFPELSHYPYESPEPSEHLNAYFHLKPSQRIHLCVYALEAVRDILKNLSIEESPFSMAIFLER